MGGETKDTNSITFSSCQLPIHTEIINNKSYLNTYEHICVVAAKTQKCHECYKLWPNVRHVDVVLVKIKPTHNLKRTKKKKEKSKRWCYFTSLIVNHTS